MDRGRCITRLENMASQNVYLRDALKAVAVGSLPVALYYLFPLVYPTVGPGEPPVVRPRIPVIGHVIGMFREWTGMFDRL
jgi:hypothetical protein